MNSKKLNTIKQKMSNIAIKRFDAEGLTRILLCCLRDDIGCKPYDSQIVTKILYEILKQIKEDVNYIHKVLKI